MRIALLLPLLVAPLALADEPHCTPQDTPRGCIARLASGQVDAALQAGVAATNTGAPSVVSPSRSTLRDFITTLSPYFDVGTLSDGRKTFGAVYNVRQQAQFEATFPTPKVDPTLSTFIGDTQTKKAEQSLSNGDDYILALSFGPKTRLLGRSSGRHRRLVDDLLAASLSGPAVALDTPFAQAGMDAAAFETAARAAIPAAVAKLAGDLTPRVSNQPQLYGTGIYHARKNLTGPSESSFGLTFEVGTQNLDSFYRREGRDCGNACAAAFERFLQRTQNAAKADRFSFTINYKARASVQVPTTLGNVQIRTPHRIGWVVGYSRPLAALVGGKEARLDLTYTYDGMKTKGAYGTSALALGEASAVAGVAPPPRLVSEEPRDRSTLAATYTQQLSDRISAPLALVWSDHIGSDVVYNGQVSPVGPSLVETRDHRLTVRVGLVYKLPSVAPPSKPCCCQ